MTYIPNNTVTFKDSPAQDAFGRLRTSDPVTLFASQFQYDLQPLMWESALTAGGTATHLPNESSVRLRVATNGDKVIRQSRIYTRYRPGKSLLVALTFVMGSDTANVRKRLGYFDASNGIFLEQNGVTQTSIVRRTSTSGSPVDNLVAQADWNLDKFDGTGPSGITLDFTKAQILMMDLQWLGVGRVRVGFDINGVFYPAHQFLNANNLSTVYMTTANLPIRYEIEATGAIGGNTDLIQICSMVSSEGGFESELGMPRSFGRTTATSVTSRRPILSIRPKLTFNGIVNRGLILPEGVSLTAATNDSYWELVYGGTVSTGTAWTSVSANSLTEYDVGSSAISGGEVIASGFIVTASGGGSPRLQTSENIISRFPLTLDIAGTGFTTLSLVCTSFTGTSSVTGTIDWRELF